jgi:hypothetical protein
VPDVVPTEEFIELAGGRVHLLRGGTGEPVLFLHAAGGAGAWHPFHALLSGAGFEVLAPERIAFSVPVYVADTDERAHSEARPVLEWLYRKGLKQTPQMVTPPG